VIVPLPMFGREPACSTMLRKLWVLPVDIRLSAHMSKLRFHPRSYSYIGGCRCSTSSTGRFPTGTWCSSGCSTRLVGIAGADRALAGDAGDGHRHQAREQGPGAVPPEAHGFNNEEIDGSGSSARCITEMSRCHAAAKLVTKDDPRVTRVGASSARPRSTSCRSCSMSCFKGNSRSSVRVRTPCRPRLTTSSTTRPSTAISPATASSPASPAGPRSMAGAARPTRIDKIQQRVNHDLYYIENWSVLFDLYILIKTPFSLMTKNENAY
jgi:hypothetical protein